AELFIHHAGIPLALFVLLQDYRFVLLDAFVRFLANALLAAIVTWAMIQAGLRLRLLEPAGRAPIAEASLLLGVCLCLVLFAWLRGRILGWLTQAVFGHGQISGAAWRLKSAPPFEGDEEYLRWAASEIAAAARAESHSVVTQDRIAGAATLRAPVLASMCP